MQCPHWAPDGDSFTIFTGCRHKRVIRSYLRPKMRMKSIHRSERLSCSLARVSQRLCLCLLVLGSYAAGKAREPAFEGTAERKASTEMGLKLWRWRQKNKSRMPSLCGDDSADAVTIPGQCQTHSSTSRWTLDKGRCSHRPSNYSCLGDYYYNLDTRDEESIGDPCSLMNAKYVPNSELYE